MQGRLQGKRLTAAPLPREVLEHGAEACNYLLAVDVEMNTVDGYAMSSWERGYGDFEMVPDLDTLRLVPWHEGTALCLADLRVGRRRAGRRLAAADPARASSTASPSAAWRPSPAPSSSSSSSRTPTRRRSRRATASLDAGQPVQRRLLAAGHRAGRAADPPHPQPDGRRPGWWSRTPRASATTASTRSTSATGRRCGSPTSTRSTRPGPRRSPPRRSMAITFMAKYDEREGSLVPHPPVACAGLDDAGLRALRRRPARLPARADAVLRAEHQLLQALRARLVRADRGRLGPRQPHVRGARRRPRRVAPARAAAARARTSTRTSRWRR